MKTLLSMLIVPAALVGMALLVRAQDAPKVAERTAGRVLLLKSGNAMEGDIVKDGSQYRIRRERSELCLAADSVLRLCADWDDAFTHLLSTIRSDNASDRVTLARWCQRNGLTLRALEQVQIALEMQPNHAEAKQLAAWLERTMNPATQQPAVKTPTAKPQVAETPAAAVDVSFETLVDFTTKVQPILMNACATCHATDNGGKFHLERGGGQKSATQRNLAVVLSQIDFDHPKLSPLIVKAVSRHGDGVAPPIRDRNAKPAQAIQQWVEQTLAKNPQLKEYADKKNGAPAKSVTPEPKSVFQQAAVSGGGKTTGEVVSKPAEPTRVTPMPVQQTPADEFDPIIFNSWAHPQRMQQQSASNRR
jgi:hypothetical protein